MTTTTSKYNEQAQDWAGKHLVRMEARYLGHFKHFEDDTDTRDVYQIRLINTANPAASYSFRYGQSLNDSRSCDQNDGPAWVRLNRERNRLGVTFKQDAAYRSGKAPGLYSVLSCLQKYDPGTHANFCGDFGYDVDSRKGLELYLRVQEEWREVARFCGGEESEMMRELRDIN